MTEKIQGELPANFPHRDALAAAGVTTFEDLRTVVQMGPLTDIHGVDAKAAEEISQAATELQSAADADQGPSDNKDRRVDIRRIFDVPINHPEKRQGPGDRRSLVSADVNNQVTGEDAKAPVETVSVKGPETTHTAEVGTVTTAPTQPATEVPASSMPPGGKFLSPETRIEAALTNINSQISSVKSRTNGQGQPDRAALNLVADCMEQAAAAIHDRLSDQKVFAPSSEFSAAGGAPPPARLQPQSQSERPEPGSAARWPYMGTVGSAAEPVADQSVNQS